jgi:hypothetical protein
LNLIARLRGEQPERSLSDVLRLDGDALRFHLGTSLADLRVPFHVDEAFSEVLRAAVRDLFFLLTIRHRLVLREAEHDKLILLDGFDPRASRPVSHAPPLSVKSQFVRRAFEEGPELHPALDSGLLASWLGSGRPGRMLAHALNSVLRRAMDEAASHEPPERTAHLVLLALRGSMRTALSELRELPVSGPVARSFSGAVGAGLLVVARLSLAEAHVADPGAETGTGALPWLGGVRTLWGGGFSGYGVAFAEQPPRLDVNLARLLQGGTPEQVARDAHASLNASKELSKKAARLVGLSKLRGELLQLVRLAETGRAPSLAT